MLSTKWEIVYIYSCCELAMPINNTILLVRFGYDHPGGYERDMGGRIGYPDERPHGRYMGRLSGGYQGIPSVNLCCHTFTFSCLHIMYDQ